jgi:outer membrane protein assembly factor BamB
MQRPTVRDGVLYIRGFHSGKHDEEARIFALEASSGKVLWDVEGPGFDAGVERDPIVATSDGKLLVGKAVLDAKTGQQLALGEPLRDLKSEALVANPPPLTGKVLSDQFCYGGVIYAVDSQHRLCAFDLSSKKVKFVGATPASQGDTWCSMSMAEGLLLVFGQGVAVHDPQTGKPAWSFTGTNLTIAVQTPVIADQVMLLTAMEFVQEKDSSFSRPLIIAVDLATGKEKWRYGPCLRVVDAAKGIVRVTHDMGYADKSYSAGLDLATGEEKWRHPWAIVGTVVGDIAWRTTNDACWPDFARSYTGDKRGSKLLAGWMPDHLYKSWAVGVDPETNDGLWQSPVMASTQISSPFIADGVLYCSSISEMAEGRSGVWDFKLH